MVLGGVKEGRQLNRFEALILRAKTFAREATLLTKAKLFWSFYQIVTDLLGLPPGDAGGCRRARSIDRLVDLNLAGVSQVVQCALGLGGYKNLLLLYVIAPYCAVDSSVSSSPCRVSPPHRGESSAAWLKKVILQRVVRLMVYVFYVVFPPVSSLAFRPSTARSSIHGR